MATRAVAVPVWLCFCLGYRMLLILCQTAGKTSHNIQARSLTIVLRSIALVHNPHWVEHSVLCLDSRTHFKLCFLRQALQKQSVDPDNRKTPSKRDSNSEVPRVRGFKAFSTSPDSPKMGVTAPTTTYYPYG